MRNRKRQKYFDEHAKNCEICGKKYLWNGRKLACSNLCNIKINIKIDENDCWIWQKTKDISGYGEVMDYDTHKCKKVHRFTYELFIGTIPEGKFVLHKCDIRACCNPDHLWIGNQSDNIKDATQKNRMKNQFQSHERHWNHKLTLEEVKEIKEMKKMGIASKDIANNFGVHVETIRDILKGRTWKNLGE